MDEGEVEDTDYPSVDQVDEHRQCIAGWLLPLGPFQDDVVDRSDLDASIVHPCLLPITNGVARLRRAPQHPTPAVVAHHPVGTTSLTPVSERGARCRPIE